MGQREERVISLNIYCICTSSTSIHPPRHLSLVLDEGGLANVNNVNKLNHIFLSIWWETAPGPPIPNVSWIEHSLTTAQCRHRKDKVESRLRPRRRRWRSVTVTVLCLTPVPWRPTNREPERSPSFQQLLLSYFYHDYLYTYKNCSRCL